MPTINFKKQFISLIESGKKKQTIRLLRKRKIKVGDPLYLYTGQRTKYCRKIREVICKSVDEIKINYKGVYINKKMTYYCLEHLDIFAILDGFTDWTEMIKWFEDTHGLPFEGILIKW